MDIRIFFVGLLVFIISFVFFVIVIVDFLPNAFFFADFILIFVGLILVGIGINRPSLSSLFNKRMLVAGAILVAIWFVGSLLVITSRIGQPFLMGAILLTTSFMVLGCVLIFNGVKSRLNISLDNRVSESKRKERE